MTDIVRYESDPLSEQLKAKWASRLKPVDNFTITEWPGKLEDTSLICDIAVQDQDLFAEHSSDAIIPYVNQETADYYEVFDFTQEETPKASAEKTADYADRLDKSIALASGLLTGLIDVLFVGEFWSTISLCGWGRNNNKLSYSPKDRREKSEEYWETDEPIKESRNSQSYQAELHRSERWWFWKKMV